MRANPQVFYISWNTVDILYGAFLRDEPHRQRGHDEEDQHPEVVEERRHHPLVEPVPDNGIELGFGGGPDLDVRGDGKTLDPLRGAEDPGHRRELEHRLQVVSGQLDGAPVVGQSAALIHHVEPLRQRGIGLVGEAVVAQVLGLQRQRGIGGEQLHDWVVVLEAWRHAHGKQGGEVNESTRVMEEELANIGATIMGRNMFGGGPGPWSKTDAWNGWWGRNPPFHHPVFVLTHHGRPPAQMEGGTVYHFVTSGIREALDRLSTVL